MSEEILINLIYLLIYSKLRKMGRLLIKVPPFFNRGYFDLPNYQLSYPLVFCLLIQAASSICANSSDSIFRHKLISEQGSLCSAFSVLIQGLAQNNPRSKAGNGEGKGTLLKPSVPLPSAPSSADAPEGRRVMSWKQQHLIHQN